ncbi:hypothetical protein ROHU_006366 [Labeo rohita]|uniref:Uncharacterized protein n=1 Tax=Labeo rohita TaxID=84645 RepID=A0A498MTJ1_LABRO|nr:hypothetical protein ROHU_006366 [Labeo rohita]
MVLNSPWCEDEDEHEADHSFLAACSTKKVGLFVLTVLTALAEVSARPLQGWLCFLIGANTRPWFLPVGTGPMNTPTVHPSLSLFFCILLIRSGNANALSGRKVCDNFLKPGLKERHSQDERFFQKYATYQRHKGDGAV